MQLLIQPYGSPKRAMYAFTTYSADLVDIAVKNWVNLLVTPYPLLCRDAGKV